MSRFLTYEDELNYLIELIESDDANDWEKAVYELEMNCHSDSLRKAWNNTKFSGYRVAKYFIEKQTKYLADEEIERIEALKHELYKERVKLQDQRRELKKDNVVEARFEHLVDVLKENIELLEPIALNPFKAPTNSTDKTYAVLQLSDWHCGQKACSPFGFYDIETMKNRANKIIDKTIFNCQKNNVTDLIVEINGDMIEGEINISGKVEAEEGTVKQIITVSEVLAQCINKLKPHFKSIKVVTTLGNHGRLGKDKTKYSTQENFEMLIPEFLKLRLNIPIHSSYGLDFTSYEIDGELICVTHGQNDKLSTIVNDFTQLYKRVPKEIHIGHVHSYSDRNECGVNIVANGSLSGTGDFSLQCRKSNKGSQNLIIYGTDRCIYPLEVE